MPVRRVEVSAPSRLHFGMLPIGAPGGPYFGGAGAMIDRPRLHIGVERCDGRPAVHVNDPRALRAIQFARQAARHWGGAEELPLRIEVHDAAEEHVGLGSGTQLGMAVAAAVARFLGREPRGPEELAASVGRGRRSAVGLHGFWHGGLIVAGGPRTADDAAPLVARVALPEAWRFVLLRPRGSAGLSGEAERRAFARLCERSSDGRRAFDVEALVVLADHAAHGEYDAFCDALFAYNRRAGEVFADCQGGPFAHQPWIARLRDWGYRGIGQSSWGPTIFVVVPHDEEADRLCGRLSVLGDDLAGRPLVAAGDNRGAVVVEG